MHVMTRYLDTRKAAIAALQDFPLMEHAAEDTSHIVDQREDLVHPASPRLDGLPRYVNPHGNENRIAATLDKIDLLAENANVKPANTSTGSSPPGDY